MFQSVTRLETFFKKMMHFNCRHIYSPLLCLCLLPKYSRITIPACSGSASQLGCAVEGCCLLQLCSPPFLQQGHECSEQSVSCLCTLVANATPQAPGSWGTHSAQHARNRWGGECTALWDAWRTNLPYTHKVKH